MRVLKGSLGYTCIHIRAKRATFKVFYAFEKELLTGFKNAISKKVFRVSSVEPGGL